MNTPLRIDITDDAATQIAAAARWWNENRPATAEAVLEDLDRILGLMCVQPAMGARARRVSLSGVRRITLSRIRHYVYFYRPREGFDSAELGDRFEREARTLANMDTHTNIVTVYESGDYLGKP